MVRLIICLSATAILGGCVSKSQADAQARAAYFQGQAQAQARAMEQAQIQAAQQPGQGPSVFVLGNVRNPNIPWTQDLTLVRAIVAAEYLGVGDPNQITVLRAGQQPIIVSARQLLSGQDMPLAAGDRIEIR